VRRTLVLAAALAVALPLLAACGNDDDGTGTTSGPSASASVSANSSVGKEANCKAFEGVPAIEGTWGTAPDIGKPKGEAPTKLGVEDCLVGTGEEVTDIAKPYDWNYEGVTWSEGQKFDSSFDRGQAISFSLNQVIPGWTEGLKGMKVGGRRLLVIPSDQAYGPAGSPPIIGPNEPLVFVVDLVGPTATAPTGAN
jgi:hypothetical protein